MKRILSTMLLSVALASITVAAPPRGKAPAKAQVAAETVSDARQWLANALTAYRYYRIDDARQWYDKVQSHASLLTQLSDSDRELAAHLPERIDRAESMLDRVEQTIVIDSVEVPIHNFFNHFRLSPTSGHIITPPQWSRLDFRADSAQSVYLNDLLDHMVWAQSTPAALVQSNLLSDGTWESPQPMPGDNLKFSANDRVAFPFLLSDGLTLYYGADTHEGLGGYDIYMTRRDPDTGYLAPQNLGMPYNSPANDYMMVIDEENSLGWWATDRNSAPGMVTIYTFIPSELRKNYPVSETHDIAARALLSSIDRSLIPPKANDRIPIQTTETQLPLRNTPAAFALDLPDGNKLTDDNISHYPSLATTWKDYKEACRASDLLSRKLDAMRRSWQSGANSQPILDTEQLLEVKRQEIRTLSNAIISGI